MRYSIRETKKIQNDTQTLVFVLMLICFIFLVLGNIIFHLRFLPVKEHSISRYFSFNLAKFPSFVEFFWAVFKACRLDILCVVLIAFSPFTRFPRAFLAVLFMCRSFLFGFCGAHLIAGIGETAYFFRGFFSWLLFFLYHISLFSILIHFGAFSAYFHRCIEPYRHLKYLLTIFCELALVVFLNLVYYFLISKI